MPFNRHQEPYCRGSWKILAAGGLVALLTLLVAWIGDDAFGELFAEWGPLVIATVGGTLVISFNAGCCRPRRDRPGPEAEDDASDAICDWPSA